MWRPLLTSQSLWLVWSMDQPLECPSLCLVCLIWFTPLTRWLVIYSFFIDEYLKGIRKIYTDIRKKKKMDFIPKTSIFCTHRGWILENEQSVCILHFNNVISIYWRPPFKLLSQTLVNHQKVVVPTPSPKWWVQQKWVLFLSCEYRS